MPVALPLGALDARSARWLGAVAVEHTLERKVLARIFRAEGEAMAAWLADAIATAVLRERGDELMVHPHLRQTVLRSLARRGELVEIAALTEAQLGARSVGILELALQRGDLDAFTRAFPTARSTRRASEWLRESISVPFDAEWLESTFRERATEVAARVLAASLAGPTACPGVVEWLATRRSQRAEPSVRGRDDEVDALLAQHAFLSGDVDALRVHPAYAAAARFLEGDLEGAQRSVERATRAGPLGAVAPPVALLLCARGTETAISAAKRVLAAATTDAERAAARAFRTLLRYLQEPSAAERRINVQQVSEDAGAWELLLLAFTVHLHHEQPWARASWSQRLARKAREWQEAGYAWLARQTAVLANELSAEYCARELTDSTLLHRRSGELSLWDLLTAKPDWKKTLEALAEVSQSAAESVDVPRRVAWFLDMDGGTFARPALQELSESTGWSEGRRLSVAELHEMRDALPSEDARILDCSRESTVAGDKTHKKRALTDEAYEMLIGHPRVFDGVRGAAVEVVRGTCRVETEDDGGHIRMVVEPQGARLGVNLVAQEGRLVVYRVTPLMRRVIDALPHGVRIPKSHEPEVRRVLGRLSHSIDVRGPLLGAERSVEADATPCLRFSPKAGAWLVQLGVRPFGERGRFFVAGLGRATLVLHEDGERTTCTRDFTGERAAVDALIAACPTLQEEERGIDEDIDSWIFGEASVLSLLADLRDADRDHPELRCALEWPESGALRLSGTVHSKSLHGRLRSRKGWYLATGGVRLDEINEISLSDLVRAPAVGNGRFLRLASGDYLEVEQRVRSVLDALASATRRRRGGGDTPLEVHPAAVATLRKLAAPESGFEVDEATNEWLARVASLTRESFAAPPALRAQLRDYQLEGYRWLRRLGELGLGACLADDMGLGKTVQILALLVACAGEGPALVVAPTSVCSNWAREIERFAPSLSAHEYLGKTRADMLARLGDDAVVICSYALLQQNQALREVAWSTVVLDEAQMIKNAESLRAQAAFRLTAKRRIAATGTPVENHFGDLFSIFQFLNPGLLGDWPSFRRRFVHPLESGSSGAGPEGLPPELALRELVRPYLLRRRKADVLTELPPVTEVQRDVFLSAEQALRYAYLRKQIHDRLFGARPSSKLEVLAEITRLRRFCCHPRLVFPDAPAESPKIDALLAIVEELRENGHRALVFSQYVDFLGLVREQLDERRIAYEYLDGSTPAAARPARVDAFQNGSAPLFLISLKAGGFGLNLTAADYVIHLDPWWNPAVQSQATDRAHRIGQSRRVTAYRLVTKETIEEQIVELHGKKQKLARSLLEGGEQAAQLEVDELLRLIER